MVNRSEIIAPVCCSYILKHGVTKFHLAMSDNWSKMGEGAAQ